MELLEQRVHLYGGCALPSVAFYLVTRNQTTKKRGSGPSDWVLLLISLLEILAPISFNGKGTVLDRVVCAVMAIVMTSGMWFYISNRRSVLEGKLMPPFYEILTRWNEKKPDSQMQHVKALPLADIRRDAFLFLVRSILYCLIYIPVFAVMDGFVRACNEPPESFTPTSYIWRLLTGHIPMQTLFYYFWTGVTLSWHIALIPLVHLLLHAIQLNIVAWLPNINMTILVKLHRDLTHFVAQPPLFDKPWLTRSVYELWSKRWHQVFRPGFHHIAYNPVRRLFGVNHKVIGRIIGSIAVFMCSGFMHDYIMLAMLGYKNYDMPGALGHQTLFFFLQGVATIVSLMSPKLPVWISRTLTWLWVLYTAPLFVEPYLRVGLHIHAEVPGFPKFMDDHIGIICPYGVKDRN